MVNGTVVGTMPITITADKADEIPEPLRANAKEENGKFVVPGLPEGWGVDNVAASSQLRAKLTKAEADSKRAAERMKAFAKDDKGTIYEPDEFAALLAKHKQLEEAQGKAPNIEDLRRQITVEAEGTWSKKFTEAEKRAQELERERDSEKMEGVIGRILADMRPKEGKAEIVQMLLLRDFGLDKSDGKPVVRVRSPDGKDWLSSAASNDGYMSPKDYAMNVLRTKHADLFQGDGASGAGASSATGGSRRAKYTFKKADLNGRVAEWHALQARAKAEGVAAELID